jgi:hypothetical protein
MSLPRAFGFCAAALVGWSACAEKQDRPPPYTSQCDGVGCLPPHVGNAGEAGEGSEVTLSGVVGLLADDQFDVADTFPETVDLRAESPRAASVVGVWTGSVSDPFLIEGVLSAPAIWVHGKPRAGGSDALPTLEPMRTNNPDENGIVYSESPFVLVRASVIDEVFTLASTPVLPDATRAHVVLQLVSGSAQNGLAGVTVTAPQAELVMYGVNGTFSDIPEETDGSGLVVLGNIPASTWPGRTLAISFSGSRTSSVELPVMTGSVTIVPIEP